MNRKRTGRFVALATSAFFVLAFAAPALAQTGQLKGKVVDQADKPVEGAKVTISAKQTKSSRDVKTNKRGEWIQIGLFPGEYTITAEKDGDKGNVDFKVSVGDNPEVMIRIGKAGPSPEAAAKAAALQKSFDEGVALSKASDWDGSIPKFNEAIAQAPNCHDCYYNIGYANTQKKDWENAEVAYKKATELKPDYAEAWNALANVYNQQKKLDLALEASNNAAKYGAGATGGGGSATGLYNQAVILWNQQKFPEAKAKLEEATKSDASHAESFALLARVNINLGDFAGAIAAYESYLKLAPNGPHAAKAKEDIAQLKPLVK